MENKVNQIHQLIKEAFPEAVRVDIAVVESEISVNLSYRTNLKDYNMKNISGKWVKTAVKGGGSND